MYIRPILPLAGGLCPTQAPAQSIAAASMHIGSGPGVAGLSAMQVKPLLPARTVRMLPSGCIATMVAPPATFPGAACIALSINGLSSMEAAAGVSPDIDMLPVE